VRHKEHRARSVYHLGMLLALMAAESMALPLPAGFRQETGLHAVPEAIGPGHGGRGCALRRLFTVSVPLKIWNSARNERLLEAKERLLVQARLAALATQINPHFLFNTLTRSRR